MILNIVFSSILRLTVCLAVSREISFIKFRSRLVKNSVTECSPRRFGLQISFAVVKFRSPNVPREISVVKIRSLGRRNFAHGITTVNFAHRVATVSQKALFTKFRSPSHQISLTKCRSPNSLSHQIFLQLLMAAEVVSRHFGRSSFKVFRSISGGNRLTPSRSISGRSGLESFRSISDRRNFKAFRSRSNSDVVLK